MKSLHTDPATWRYKALIGTGGIGSGTFFALKGDHTLGREESRAGRFLDRRDYCKQHIIEHYVQRLMGPAFRTVPIGRVGADEPGRRMIEEMRRAGLTTEHVQVVGGEQTLFSVCFVDPDGTGGNLTVDDSASAKVGPEDIRRVEGEFARFTGKGIALAAPEVPLEARAELLRLGQRYRLFNTASFTSAELRGEAARRMLRIVDYLAANRDEAATLGGVRADGPIEQIVEAALRTVRSIQPNIQLSITAGRQGSWTWDGQTVTVAPAVPVRVAGTAGAGDAFFGGMQVGLAVGLTLAEAQQLATLAAAVSVTSPHTIHEEVDRESLRALACEARVPLSPGVRRLVENAA